MLNHPAAFPHPQESSVALTTNTVSRISPLP